MKSNSFKIQWHPRGEPRVPAAVAASGTVAKDLARKLLASDQTMSYLGSDERAPHLFLPTNRDPNVPLDLLQQALIEQCPFQPPLAFVETRNTVISLSQARELSRDVLRSWLLTAS